MAAFFSNYSQLDFIILPEEKFGSCLRIFKVLHFIVVIVWYCSHLYVVRCLGLLAVSFFSHFSNIFSLRVSSCTSFVSRISLIKLSLWFFTA